MAIHFLEFNISNAFQKTITGVFRIFVKLIKSIQSVSLHQPSHEGLTLMRCQMIMSLNRFRWSLWVRTALHDLPGGLFFVAPYTLEGYRLPIVAGATGFSRIGTHCAHTHTQTRHATNDLLNIQFPM